ncbi:MAG: PIG-L deacetylase family protein [Nostocoides sp.]
MPPPHRRTIVAFHAHPDDEALLTAGTMAKAAAEGHRVVTVFATDGDLGLASSDFRDGASLGQVRRREAQASAAALGTARVEWLGYADSGIGDELYPDPAGMTRFVRAPVEQAAGRLAEILRQEHADVLLSYDAAGGYGHRDHVQVHHVGAAAAALTGTRVLEATIPRDTINRAIRLASRLYRFPPEFDPRSFERAYSARADITHRIPVRRYAAQKRAAMAAHASQGSADGDADRTLAAFLRVPRPAYAMIFGREWFRDPAHPRGGPALRDIFDGEVR